MKIITREAFLSLPPGTVFSKYSPVIFGDLCIKGNTLCHCRDFTYQSIVDAIEARNSSQFSDMLGWSQESGMEIAMSFDCMGRDGCFDDDQLFAIWATVDVMKLVKRLLVACGDALSDSC